MLSNFGLASWISNIRFSSLRYFHNISKSDRRKLMMSKFGPPIDRSMRSLDRSFFKKDIPMLVARFPDPVHLGQFVKVCKNDILCLPSIKHIVPLGNSKGVILREDIEDIDNHKNQVSELTLNKIHEYGIIVEPYILELAYDFWRADDILRAILPENLLDDIPTGFAQAGHVAHLNLRDEFKPYGQLIGQVILDKNPKIDTVVDKVDTIDTKFRTFQMKILAGKDDLIVEQSESGCKFRFDFSKVYWNSRLSTEHDRLVSQFNPKDAVCDVFAGVGPFAVPAGKKNVLVLANDLNPSSYRYLLENITLNGVQDFVRPFNLDGRDFIQESPKLLQQWSEDSKVIEKKKLIKRRKIDPVTHEKKTTREYELTKVEIPRFFSDYVMNLPDSAITFLDAFIGLYHGRDDVKKITGFKLPKIHVHCFEKFSPHDSEPSIEELNKRTYNRIIKILDFDIPFSEFSFHLVRKVAPTKPMFCVSFTLPEEVAFRAP
ncbi:uncharacterized protein PRCAT00000504001 [Priceomyces carsonii]|uniref:uncharacterized protein n=1 Tax=Priceomyces carsonii TaxID=28549 RepID=UPI002EDAF22B|nr:unnamed protein product [Priceomyces carsonii]